MIGASHALQQYLLCVTMTNMEPRAQRNVNWAYRQTYTHTTCYHM